MNSKAFISAAAFLLSCSPGFAADKIFYGSRIGMEVDIISVSGLGSNHAVIKTRHTRENAKAFCEKYNNDPSEKCVDQVLKDTRLNDEIEANCETGVFTALNGEHLRFAGKNKKKRNTDPMYLILNDGKPLDGSSASGYPYTISQFKALCPARVPVDDE